MTSRLKQAEKLKLKTIENEPQKVQPPKIMTTVEKTKNILAAIQDKLIHDLDEHTIIIPNHKIPFQKPNENEKNEQQKQGWLKLQKVIQQKQQIKRKLNEVEKSQRLLQAGIDLTAIREKRIRPRSQLSTEDIEKLKKLKRQQKKFEQYLNIKTKLYQQSQRKHKQQQKILHEQQIKQTNEKKKQQIKKRLEELAERQKQRAAKFEEEKANYSKIRIQKRLHEQIAQKWEKSQKEVEQQKRKQLEQRKKQKSVDFAQLKQHEKKYEEIIQKNRQDMSKKRLQSSRTNNNFKSRLHQSKFYTLVVEEEAKKKNQENERKQIVVQLLERKKQFAEIVKRSYAPKVKQRSEENQEEEKKKSTVKKTVLDPQQFRRRGLSYLEEAKSKGNKSLKENQKSIEIEVETLSDNKTKYHDYLTEYRRNREKSDEKSVKYEKNFNRDVQEAKNIMKKTSFSQKQKIQRVKMLAQKIQFDPKTSKSSTLLKKIQAKIQILEALQ